MYKKNTSKGFNNFLRIINVYSFLSTVFHKYSQKCLPRKVCSNVCSNDASFRTSLALQKIKLMIQQSRNNNYTPLPNKTTNPKNLSLIHI